MNQSYLAFLAAEAAVDLDNYRQGKSQEDESIKHLSKLLNKITQEEDPEVKRLDNPIILSYAISGREDFQEYWKDKSADEVLLQTNLVAKDLRDFRNLSKTHQEELTDFCVRLSREAQHQYGQYPFRLTA